MRSLAIGPQEAFVLSRVDGMSSESQIAAATGLDIESVNASLTRLRELGAVTYTAEEPRQVSVNRGWVSPAASTNPPASMHKIQYDPSELDEAADIPTARKHQILEAFYSLEFVTHYELLKVAQDAEKKAIKAAYYEVVNVFHPDRYFGKSLGSYKSKLERLFARMTEAHEVLTRKATRAEYDDYLATRRRANKLDALLTNEHALEQEVKRAQALIEREAQTQANGDTLPPTEAVRVSYAPPSFRPSRQAPRRLSDPEIRRKALARKLRGSGTTSPTASVSSEKDTLREHIDIDLKQRYQARLATAKQNQVRHYLDAATTAEAANDPVYAANALRIAVQLDPDNAALLERLDTVQVRATQALASTYLHQAQYEERERHWERAANNYEKAARGQSDASLYDRAASCLLAAGSDWKRAGELARKAVELAPNSAEFRITLARIYAGAKMLNSAVMEAERAVTLAADEESAKAWLKRIKRGENPAF